MERWAEDRCSLAGSVLVFCAGMARNDDLARLINALFELESGMWTQTRVVQAHVMLSVKLWLAREAA